MLLVATTRDNVSPSLILELLRRIAGIIKVLSPGTQADQLRLLLQCCASLQHALWQWLLTQCTVTL